MPKLSSGFIKSQIPGWLTDAEAEKLRSQFSPSPFLAPFVKVARDPKNWKRMYKGAPENFGSTQGIERAFDCRPFDGQLRLYVLTDPQDQRVLSVLFQTE